MTTEQATKLGDRVSFIKRCEADIETCLREASNELRAGYMLNSLVWQVKVPLLRMFIEGAKREVYEASIVAREAMRVEVMSTVHRRAWTMFFADSMGSFDAEFKAGVTREHCRVLPLREVDATPLTPLARITLAFHIAEGALLDAYALKFKSFGILILRRNDTYVETDVDLRERMVKTLDSLSEAMIEGLDGALEAHHARRALTGVHTSPKDPGSRLFLPLQARHCLEGVRERVTLALDLAEGKELDCIARLISLSLVRFQHDGTSEPDIEFRMRCMTRLQPMTSYRLSALERDMLKASELESIRERFPSMSDGSGVAIKKLDEIARDRFKGRGE